MTYKDLTAAIAALNEAYFNLEDEYEMNGGEVTESTEAQEAQIAALQALLETEGIDLLGRWLKGKEDAVKALKAERDAIVRQIRKAEDSIEFIKSEIYNVLTAVGKEKVKGTCYSFAAAISRKTEVDKDILEDKYLGVVNQALDQILPPWVSVKISASVKAVPGDIPMPDEFKVVETPSCKFVKPRANKEV